MLVDGEMMVHVELHLRVDPAEIGHEAAEHIGLIHAPKDPLRPLRRGHDLNEQAVGLGVFFQGAVDQAQILGDQTQSVGVDVQVVALGDMK